MMKSLLTLTALGIAASAITATPSFAGFDFGPEISLQSDDVLFRKGRGRGRGGDDDRGDDSRRDDDDNDRSGRDRPRIPGGSGCDDPGDVAEHPECRG